MQLSVPESAALSVYVWGTHVCTDASTYAVLKQCQLVLCATPSTTVLHMQFCIGKSGAPWAGGGFERTPLLQLLHALTDVGRRLQQLARSCHNRR
jgi:hypothetical protein